MRTFLLGSRSKRLVSRVYRRVAVVVVFLVLFTVAMPDHDPGGFAPARFSWQGVWSSVSSWLAVPGGWAAPGLPDTPKQQSGTAVGRGHLATSAATRAGGGAGRAPGKGQGEL